jgi:hypothetical protein
MPSSHFFQERLDEALSQKRAFFGIQSVTASAKKTVTGQDQSRFCARRHQHSLRHAGNVTSGGLLDR